MKRTVAEEAVENGGVSGNVLGSEASVIVGSIRGRRVFAESEATTADGS